MFARIIAFFSILFPVLITRVLPAKATYERSKITISTSQPVLHLHKTGESSISQKTINFLASTENLEKIVDPILVEHDAEANYPLVSDLESKSPFSSGNLAKNQSPNQASSLPASSLNSSSSQPKAVEDYPLVSQLAQNQLVEKLNDDRDFITPPRIVPNQNINPLTTTILLNGTSISHLTEFETLTGYEFGQNRNDNLTFNGILKLNSQVQTSLTRDNIYTIDQLGNYLQLETVLQSRDISVTRVEPRTLIGLQLQFSLTASCFSFEPQSTQQCTYTPAITTDSNNIDPNTFLPKSFDINNNFREVVTPDSLAAIQQPGFQRGANGQEIGLDLYLPNVGSSPGNSQSNITDINRIEEVKNTPATFFSNVRQIVKVNDEEAVIGRTVRGLGFVVDDKNTDLNLGLQLGAEFLPDLVPSLNGSVNPVNRNVNRNLFLAANNTRLPSNSFTIYQAGLGRASTPKISSMAPIQLSPASFNSIWFGISPVTDRTFAIRQLFEVTGPERLLVTGGVEGGIDDNLNIDFIFINENDILNLEDLEDFYIQAYFSIFNRDVNLITTSNLNEKISYYPHVSFTGNITGTNDVFRYYGGSIFSETLKPYLGLDYSKITLDGWRYNFGAIGYANPDRDYYSRVLGGISKIIPLSSTSSLVFSTAFNYALDRETQIGDRIVISPASFVRLGASANLGSTSIGLISYLGDILPDSIDNTLLINFAIRPIENVSFSAYFAPINDNSSRTRYGASAQVRLGKAYNSPTLTLNYTNYEFDFGRDSFERELLVNDNVFKILFRFGEPPQPFSNQVPREPQEELAPTERPTLPISP